MHAVFRAEGEDGLRLDAAVGRDAGGGSAVIYFAQRDDCAPRPIDSRKTPMNQHMKRPTMTDAEVKREIVNDSLGTIDQADSTGSDETQETGDMKNENTESGKTEAGRASMRL